MLRVERKREKLDFPFATINIILLLLFFFIVTGSIMGANETGVEPPLTERTLPERLPRPLLVVDPSGALFLDDTLISVGEIVSRLRAKAAGKPPFLNIVADRDFPADRFLAIIETVRREGVPVRIVTVSDVGAP